MFSANNGLATATNNKPLPLNQSTWYIFKDNCKALLETKDYFKYCDGTFDGYLNEVISVENGREITRKESMPEKSLAKHNSKQVKTAGILRQLCQGQLYNIISELRSPKEIWDILIKEFETQTVFNKIYCIHELFYTKLESSKEADVKNYLDLKERKYNDSQRMGLNLPKEILPLLVLAGLSGPWQHFLREYVTKETVTFDEVKKRLIIELENVKQGFISSSMKTEQEEAFFQKAVVKTENCAHCLKPGHDFSSCFFFPAHPSFNMSSATRENQKQLKAGNTQFMKRIENGMRNLQFRLKIELKNQSTGKTEAAENQEGENKKHKALFTESFRDQLLANKRKAFDYPFFRNVKPGDFSFWLFFIITLGSGFYEIVTPIFLMFLIFREQDKKINQHHVTEKCFMLHENALSSVNGNRSTSETWYIDSGATSHMTGYKSSFQEGSYEQNRYGNVQYGDGSIGRIIGRGTVNASGIILQNVLHVEGMKTQLISLSCLLKSGRKAVLTKNGGTFVDNANIKHNIECEGNLFRFTRDSAKCFAATNSALKLELAHQLLGHASLKAIKKVFPFLKGQLPFCETCAKGKLKSKPFRRKEEYKAKAILENTQSDLKGPLPEGWNGEHYILTLIDEFSRYLLVRLLKYKSEAANAIKEMISEFENYCQLEGKTRNNVSGRVITFKTDGGGEYSSTDLHEWCIELGITHLMTAPYTPSSNGLAEIINQTLMGKTRCLLIDANLTTTLWPYAILYSVYLYNITPHVSLKMKTPYEIFHNRDFKNYKELVKFGSFCVSHKGGEILKKAPFESRGYDSLYLGTNHKDNLHTVLNLETLEVNDRVRTIKTSDSFLPNEILEKLGLERGTTEFDKFKPVLPDEDYNDELDSDGSQNYIENLDGCEELPCNEYVPNKDQDGCEEHPINVRIQSYENECEEHSNNFVPQNERPIRKAKLNAIVNMNDIFAFHTALSITSKTDNVPNSYNECANDSNWIESMNQEIESLKSNKTWILVPRPQNRKVLKSKWVYRVKTDLDGKILRYKSRLVVQGFRQKYLEDYIDTFSNVLHKSSFRCLVSLAASENLLLRHVDIDTAFLNADIEAGVDLYMEQPEGFIDKDYPNHVCLLQKSLYGIKQAPRLWQADISTFLKDTLSLTPTADPCILTNKEKTLFLGLYVDDIIIAVKDEPSSNRVIDTIRSKYKCKDLGWLKSYIGFEIVYTESGIFLTQRAYIDQILQKFNMENCIPGATPFKSTITDIRNWKTNTDAPYRSAIGALLYLSNGTRPDISYVISLLSRHVEKPTAEAWDCVKQIMRYLKSTKDLGIHYSKDNQRRYIHEVTAYSDSDWGGDVTRRSTTGTVIFHNGNLVDWTSNLQKCISLSSCESEIIALSHTTQNTLWIKKLITDLQTQTTSQNEFVKLPIIYADNQSAIKVARDPQHFGRMKHVDLRDLFVREKVTEGVILVEYVPSKENIADILTKVLPKDQFFYLREKLGLQSLETLTTKTVPLHLRKRKPDQSDELVFLTRKAKVTFA
jgi:hypothetical protein